MGYEGKMKEGVHVRGQERSCAFLLQKVREREQSSVSPSWFPNFIDPVNTGTVSGEERWGPKSM